MANAALNEEVNMDTIGMTPKQADAVQTRRAARKVTIRLLRNYRPMGDFDVLGYHKDPVLRKRPDGKMVTIEPGGFVTETDPETGKIMSAPSVRPGTGFADRVNAGTVIRVPSDEARRMREHKIGEVEIDD